MSYYLPQVQVHLEFESIITSTGRRLPPLILAPHAYLVRHSDADEKPKGLLGYYDSETDTEVAWPTRPADSKIDLSYTKLFIENGLLKYFEESVETGSSIQAVSGHRNRIRASSVAFKANGAAYPRSDELLPERDVKVGDVARVRALVDDVEYEKWTYVNGFVGDTVAAIVDDIEADTANQNAASVGTVVTKTGGVTTCVNLAASAAAYSGLADRAVTETYTVVVTRSSIGGDITTARLRVISASGLDDDSDVSPSALGSPTSLGSRGLTGTFSLGSGDCSDDAEADNVSPDDLIAGQTWQIAVTDGYVVTTPSNAGTYTGLKNTTYIITVTQGGDWASAPQVTISTTNGYDVSGPIEVATGVEFDVGTKGLTATFTGGTGLVLGDRFLIPATAAKEGLMKTLVLGHSLDAEVVGGTEVELTLFIRKDVAVPARRINSAPLVNWSQDQDTFTVKEGITAVDSSWTISGVVTPLPVFSAEAAGYGKVYLEYRAWRSELAYDIFSLDADGALSTAISGSEHPDNPLKYGVSKAQANAGSCPVRYIAITDPDDIDAWQAALDLAEERNDIYNLAPMSSNLEVHQACQAHVTQMSTPEIGLRRGLFVPLPGVPRIAVLDNTTSSDSEEILATIADNPNVSGTQYTLVTITSGNADLLTAGVRAGDTLRCIYTSDGWGDPTYTSYKIASVLSEQQLLIDTNHGGAVSTAQKIEIWRTLNAEAESLEIGRRAGAFGDFRVCAVWPDILEAGGREVPGYYLCAALAGAVGGVVPHQGLTRYEIKGFDNIKRSGGKFNRSQLNQMAEAGVWIVIQDRQNGQIYTRHAVTTGDTADLNRREEVRRRNADHVSYFVQDRFEPYIGISNTTDSMLGQVRVELESLREELRSANYVRRLGAQINDLVIKQLRRHTTNKDQIVLVCDLDLPAPFNLLEAHLIVI